MPARPADDGFSLIEVLVTMAITSIIGVVFGTGVYQLYRTLGTENNELTTQSQTSQALLRLEKQVRYAYSIGTVHTENGSPYLEYLTMQAVPGSTALAKTCVQLRITGTSPNQQLQSRNWTQGSPGTVTGWAVLASSLTAATTPFVRTNPTQAVNHQLLTVRVSAMSGTAVKTSTITFTALNTYASTALDTSNNPIAATAEPCYDTSVRS